MAHRILKQVTIFDPTEPEQHSEVESRCSHHEDPGYTSSDESCQSPEHLSDRERDIPPRSDDSRLEEKLKLLERKKSDLPKKDPPKAKKLRFWRPKKLRKEVKKVVKREEEKKQSYKAFVKQKVKEFKTKAATFPCFRDAFHSTSKTTPKTEYKAGTPPESFDQEKKKRETLLEKFRKRDKAKRNDFPFKRDVRTAKFSTAEKLDDPEVLNETYMRKLVARTPKCAFPVYQWHYYQTEYVEQVSSSVHENLVEMMSSLVHVDSREAQWQMEDEMNASNAACRGHGTEKGQETPAALKDGDEEGEDMEKEEGEEGEGEEEGGEAVADDQKQDEESPQQNENEGEDIEDQDDDLDYDRDDGEDGNNSAQEAMDDKDDEEETDRQSDTNTTETQNEQEKMLSPDAEPPIRYRKTKKLFNLFNFTDRGTQGCLNLNRDRMTQTSPVPMGELNAFVCSYVLYDVYQKDLLEKETRKECEGEADINTDKVEFELKAPDIDEENSSEEELEPYRSFHEETAHKTKILERMAVQNTLYELTTDMQFYDDPADEINKGEGSVLPLWVFKCEEFDGCCVTSIHFSPSYPDMVGVSHGTLDFDNNIGKGFVSVYSIKDPMTPEYKKECAEPITCFDFHPTMISYVAFSTFGGNVHCCDVRDPPESENRALHSAVEDAHLGIIWQILWDPDSENLNFYTVSSDGTLCRWNVRNAGIVKTIALVLNYPQITDSVYMKYSTPYTNHSNDSELIGAMATTMVFDPHNKEHIFIGTSEGMIIKCSLIYTTSYLMVYYSHTLNVSRIHFNPYIKSLFVSASEDRKVNIHEEGRLKPLYSFTQSAGVMDVQWAPYSSTVFALVTMDCHIVVYDLNISKAKPVCNQYVVSRFGGVQLTTLKFSPTRPIVMVGDTSGSVLSLKLSPNLRIKPKKGKRQTNFDPIKLEIMKLQTCINYIREPDSYPETTEDDSHNPDEDNNGP